MIAERHESLMQIDGIGFRTVALARNRSRNDGKICVGKALISLNEAAAAFNICVPPAFGVAGMKTDALH